MKSNNGKIILYPSNWLYNAGVIGFLRVLEKLNINYNLNENIEIYLAQIDTQHITQLIFEEWDRLFNEKFRKSYTGKGGGTQRYYYANQTERNIKEKISALFQQRNKNRKRNLILSCSFCNENVQIGKSEAKRHILKQSFGNILLGSEKTFPNTYWMLRSREFVCPKCEFILMCHHIPFINLEPQNRVEIFVNAPNFQLSYDLNKFIEEIWKGERQYEIKKLLGTSLLQWAIRRRVLLGAWTIMNIEMIIKKRIGNEQVIDYFDLPYHIIKILLDFEIADLIERTGEEKIFALIVNGKFSELEKANYFVLRGLMKLRNNERLSENDPIAKYVDRYNDENHLLNLSYLLPELNAKIIKILKMEARYG